MGHSRQFADEGTPLFTAVVPPQAVGGVHDDAVLGVALVVGFSRTLPVSVDGSIVAGRPVVLPFHHEVFQANPHPVTCV